ncbi:hypothetical protein B0H19DRAFT_1274133 [Mycena capillaripes]|nr:hypothetical protein B0H19DRAFT_1274133 [Mycena capillaripes]
MFITTAFFFLILNISIYSAAVPLPDSPTAATFELAPSLSFSAYGSGLDKWFTVDDADTDSTLGPSTLSNIVTISTANIPETLSTEISAPSPTDASPIAIPAPSPTTDAPSITTPPPPSATMTDRPVVVGQPWIGPDGGPQNPPHRLP